MSRWGAEPEDWDHWELVLGLGADLLPVVSNPGATISPDSKLKGIGKTPSVYNANGHVAGIKDWTGRQTTAGQIAKWRAHGDYGLCVQTRDVRGFDLDVPDVPLSDRIAARLHALLGVADLPVRRRADTGKRLFAFRVPGDLSKRSFRVEGGLVEFLAGGQQFVVAGTHPSGTRYDWPGGRPTTLPIIPLADFDAAWATLVEEFATEAERRADRRQGTLGEAQEIEDEVAQWLEANWETYGVQGGKLFVLCPWKDGHSADSGETEAAWMLAGTGGYAQGHFECLHASCGGRKDSEFLQCVGYRPPVAFEALGADEDELTALYLKAAAGLPVPEAGVSTKTVAQEPAPPPEKRKTAAHPAGTASLPLPGFERSKQGVILATIGNVAKAVAAPQACGARLRYDVFRGELVIASPDREDWRPLKDADAVRLRIRLASIDFEPVSKEAMRDALVLVAAETEFDTAIHWLTTIVPAWDGVDRIERFFPDYFGTDDTAYTRACGLYSWTAQAARIMEPGAKADMVPALIGPQGYRKSTGVAAISPSEEFFSEFDMELGDADLARKMRGRLVGELSELRGLGTREMEGIKAWIVRRWESWTPKYLEYETTFPRRLLFYATANVYEFLNDPTGERRWLPMSVRRHVDVDAIIRDRLQLWAEGLVRWEASGVAYEAAERLARGEHDQFRVTDPWEEPIAQWLSDTDIGGNGPLTKGYVRTGEVLSEALHFETSRITKRDEMRVGKALTTLGFGKVVRWLEEDGSKRSVKVWERGL
jgi:hypothetical protein